MVKTKEEIMEQLKTHFAEATSDDVLTLLENVSDTLDAGKDTADWKKKYEDSEAEWKKKLEDKDTEWRKKYRERFFSSEEGDKDKPDPKGGKDETKEEQEERAEQVTFDDLFNEGKKGD